MTYFMLFHFNSISNLNSFSRKKKIRKVNNKKRKTQYSEKLTVNTLVDIVIDICTDEDTGIHNTSRYRYVCIQTYIIYVIYKIAKELSM